MKFTLNELMLKDKNPHKIESKKQNPFAKIRSRQENSF